MEKNKIMATENTPTAPVEENAQENAAPVSRKKPKWLRVLGWTASILATLLILLLLFRDPIIRIATCKVGSFLTGTEVKLDKFSSTLSGYVSLRGFSVGNPKGYSKNNAIEFKEIIVSVNIGSLLTDMIKVEQILVTGMKVNFESNFTESNLGKIQSNLNAIANSGKEESPDGREESDKNAEAKKVLIVKLDATDNFVAFTSSTLSQTVSIPLPPAHLTDIGGKPVSETLGELVNILIASVGNAATSVGGAVGNAFSQTGAAVSDGVSKTGSAVTKGAKDLGKGIGDGSSKLFKSIKKTFK